MKHIISLSGGKDSTAMLFKMLELGLQIDEIIFCDTGLEFPEMLEHIKKVQSMIEMPITTLRPDKPFEWWLWDKPVNSRKTRGYGWPGPGRRWCTTHLKVSVINKYLASHRERINYIGIAVNEQQRIKPDKNLRYPLIEWGMTEQDCLDYCYKLGFDWGGLYKIKKRVSCWCCPLQDISSLRYLHNERPELWERLRGFDSGARTGEEDFFYPKKKTVADMEKRFKLEAEYIKQGKNIKSKAFFDEWKELLLRSG